MIDEQELRERRKFVDEYLNPYCILKVPFIQSATYHTLYGGRIEYVKLTCKNGDYYNQNVTGDSLEEMAERVKRCL